MTDMTPPLVEMRGITKSFFGVQVLHGVDFDLRRGEVHVLLGENGAGKSTLMKILSAAYSRDSGEILIDGRETHFTHPGQAQAAGISTIYQHFNQAPHLSVAENILLGRPPRNRLGLIDWERMERAARRALANVGVEIDVKMPVRQLSVAGRQMVEIATALNQNARILVMDEPTAALTEHEVERLFKLIRDLTARGVGVIYISHRLEEVQSLGDRVTVLRDGRNTGTRDVKSVDVDTLVRMMVGRDLQKVVVGAPPSNADEALRVEGLSAKGRFDSISFTLRQGEVVSLAGLIGSRRTDVAEAIFGARAADAGEIYVRAQRVVIRHPADAVKLRIGFLTEDRLQSGLGSSLSIRENMTLPMWARGDNYLYGILLNNRLERKLTDQYSQRLEVRARNLNLPVKYLSGGNQQKVVLAKWLIAHCNILIMDEPTAGVDIGVKEEVHRLIVKFTREDGGAVLMISSDLPEVLKLSDRVLVMAQGRLVGELTRVQATEERIMELALQTEKGESYATTN